MVLIAQFSDLHLSHDGNRSHGGFGYDTSEAWDAVRTHAFSEARPSPGLAVVTGDVVDHGLPDEYLIAVAALEQLQVPTNVLAGNHDYHVPIHAAISGHGLSMDRTQRIGAWLFIFVDSNAEFRVLGPDGWLVDTPERIETNGLLDPTEVTWIDDIIGASDAAHVWLWMHHPPAMDGTFHVPEFDAQVAGLIARHDRIRGIGAGHVHSDIVADISGVPVYVCPALTINFCLENRTTLPPGYRTYDFADDGSVTSTCHFVEDERWPRVDLPEAVIAHFRGESTWDELMEVIGGRPSQPRG